MGLIVTTDNWIPFENRSDKTLLDLLTRDGRRFLKGTRYNLSATRPWVSGVLTDPRRTAMSPISP
jgi:hypothetical protein